MMRQAHGAHVQGQDETMRLLYEASLQGSVETLNSLVQNDQLVLDRISLTHLNETPLHISALRGHIEFTSALLTHKPKLAAEHDSLRRLPLHLAAAEGHTEVVKALLSAGAAAGSCKAKDEDGRTPLHLAAMRGRIEVMQELLRLYPESIWEKVDGYTVLHLCVQYNHLEALKFLVEWVSKSNGHESILNEMDLYDYTIMHQAVILKQVETVEYLLSKEAIQIQEKENERALDLLEQYHARRDFKSFEIRELILARAGIDRPRPRPRQMVSSSSTPPSDTCLPKGIIWIRKEWIKNQFGDWIEKCRGSLMVVATVLATISFHVAANPPGGVWQEDFTTYYGCSEKAPCYAGTAVLGYAFKQDYHALLSYNTVSFSSSVGVVVILISGFPLNNKLCMWLLTLTMILSITSTWLTYIQSIALVSPDYYIVDRKVLKFYLVNSRVWMVLLGLSGLFLLLRFLCWAVHSCYKVVRKCYSVVNGCVRGEGETRASGIGTV